MHAALARDDFPLLVRLCQQSLRKNRQNLTAQRLLGFALNKCRRIEDAFKAFEQGAALYPDDPELLINYANVLIEHARNEEALPLLEKVCALRPKQAISWIKLAECCYIITLHDKGFEASQTAYALAKTPNDRVAALMKRAIHRRELGQIQEAIQDCETAISLSPADPGNYTNIILFMLSDPTVTTAQISAMAMQFSAVFERPLQAEWASFSERRGRPWRRLKIGFLSPDFRVHSVMYFIEGVLAQLDRRQFEVHAFYLFPREDYLTLRVQRHVDHFHAISGMSQAAQARSVQEAGIDILIDLAGHTGYNGLLVLARKPAPLQATWIGFPGTTGLTAVDYLITDAVTDPPGVEVHYSERLLRMPNRLCVYRPMSRNPLWRYQPRFLVQDTPALERGRITFGSCNNLGKITDTVLTVWSEILQRTPGSTLLIEGKNFQSPHVAEAYRKHCESFGIARDRLELVPLDNKNQYLTYHRIDIALDPFPLNGGTTSMDVLWMGVPLVALAGDSFKSRLTAGILLHLQRGEWLATTAEEYIQIASGLATDLPRLNALRLGLREEVEASPLMREDLFCLHLGRALRSIWLQWEAEQACPDDADAQQALIAEWKDLAPPEWATLPTPGVGIAPGHRVTLQQAHTLLEKALQKSKNGTSEAVAQSGKLEDRSWIELTELAETVLCAVPHDPVALTCLAEVEFAHGHQSFAVTYLRYAMKAMGQARTSD
jgi:protein O-GlcNAc transferase